ncbi:hypothetical protein AAFF_G00174330 [Aldrovandia affinis]|uniref:HAT C-terminal dimerisation domain-containing protein n=1 Tax=Aldrovandia affinis TaxID=143900 RepID=A0AAD7W6S4_9TELE|nr:hypothetical protein AAFF_G00174330 [Aldrovandia affinis]
MSSHRTGIRVLQRPEAAARSQQEAEMIVKFNTAYNIAKEEMPFTKFRSQILLQKKNGLNVNPTYSNDMSCALFIGVIADTLKKRTVEKIAAVPYLSFMIDGDTDISTKECEIVYARIMANGRPINILIGHVEVKHANAQGIYAATKQAFTRLGVQCEDWLEKTVAMGADGAAVNLGYKGGVIALVQQEAGDFIVPFHCMPHRLELALLSVQKDNKMIGQVYDVLNLVWKTYHFSTKSMRELKALGSELGVNVNVPSGVKGTRWLPHVARAMDTFLRPGKDLSLQDAGQFIAVYYHMDHLAGASTNADVAGRARKIKQTMEDGTFVAFCHFLADLFAAISRFSLLLQRNDIILPQAVSGIKSLLVSIEAMEARPKPGGRLAQLQADLKLQRTRQQEGEPSKESGTAKAVRCFNIIFNHDSWPEDKEQLLDHGAEELAFLLEHFSTILRRNGANVDLAKEEFEALKMLISTTFMDKKSYLSLWELMMRKEPYCSDYKNILHLVHIMMVLPVSSAVCERGFSSQKRIKSDIRASLNIDTVEDLIRISIEGPSLEDFDARESVKTWFTQGERARRPNYMGWPSVDHGASGDLL